MYAAIQVAETAGFCFGVRNAIQQAETMAAKEEGKRIYTYGPLIHNAQAIADLQKKGIYALDTLEEIPDGAMVIVRAHGISKAEEDVLRQRNGRYVDATCPFVKKIHRIVAKVDPETQIVIFGDRKHPEVCGIRGWCSGEPLIYNTLQELQENPPKSGQLLVVAQTTFDRYRFQTMLEQLQTPDYLLEVHSTICEATMKHQEEAVSIAKVSDLMVVIGGKNSSNTRKLADLCAKHCEHTIFAETKDDIQDDLLSEFAEREETIHIGITAGASTPDYVIEEAAEKLRLMFEKSAE